jgi:hypothetical protein
VVLLYNVFYLKMEVPILNGNIFEVEKIISLNPSGFGCGIYSVTFPCHTAYGQELRTPLVIFGRKTTTREQKEPAFMVEAYLISDIRMLSSHL